MDSNVFNLQNDDNDSWSESSSDKQKVDTPNAAKKLLFDIYSKVDIFLMKNVEFEKEVEHSETMSLSELR
jgi:hypothetical protein